MSEGQEGVKKCKERNGDRGNDESKSKTKDAAKSTSATAISSTVSSSPTPEPTVDCAAIGRRDTENLQREYPDPDAEDDDDESEAPESQARSLGLEVRAKSTYKPKKGKACGVDLWSGKYPPSGDEFMVRLMIRLTNRPLSVSDDTEK